MRRAFVLLAEFERAWTSMGLGDSDLQKLQYRLLSSHDVGDVIPGLSGARKIRIPLEGRGKSGGGRVIYVDVVVREKIYLITAYAKNTQTDLDPGQKRELSKLVEFIKKEG